MCVCLMLCCHSLDSKISNDTTTKVMVLGILMKVNCRGVFISIFSSSVSLLGYYMQQLIKINCSLAAKMCFGNTLNKCFECHDKTHVDLVREEEMKCSTQHILKSVRSHIHVFKKSKFVKLQHCLIFRSFLCKLFRILFQFFKTF